MKVFITSFLLLICLFALSFCDPVISQNEEDGGANSSQIVEAKVTGEALVATSIVLQRPVFAKVGAGSISVTSATDPSSFLLVQLDPKRHNTTKAGAGYLYGNNYRIKRVALSRQTINRHFTAKT